MSNCRNTRGQFARCTPGRRAATYRDGTRRKQTGGEKRWAKKESFNPANVEGVLREAGLAKLFKSKVTISRVPYGETQWPFEHPDPMPLVEVTLHGHSWLRGPSSVFVGPGVKTRKRIGGTMRYAAYQVWKLYPGDRRAQVMPWEEDAGAALEEVGSSVELNEVPERVAEALVGAYFSR